MRKLVLIAVTIVSVLAILTQTAAAANPPSRGRGTYSATNYAETSIGSVNGDTYYTYTETDVFAGVVTGTAQTYGTYVLHPDGTWKATSTSICTGCSVGGRTGDFAIASDVSGNSSSLVVKSRSIDAGGGLQGLHMTLIWTGYFTGTYSATYGFAG